MINRLLCPPANKEPVKVARVLHYLYEAGSLNRFEAAYKLHDTCLNSTISTIRNLHKIPIESRSESVNGYQDLPTICNRYWLPKSPAIREIVYWVLVKKYGYIPLTDDKPAA